MLYRLTAAAVLLLHLSFILFVVAGGLLVLRRAWWAALHLPAVVWGVAVELTSASCPLTGLENSLRMQAGQTGYSGGFIEHYLLRTIYPPDLTRNIELMLAAGVLLINVAVYARLLWRKMAPGHHIGSTDVPPAEEP